MVKADNILIVRADTLGDLVLFSGWLGALRRALPQARLRVLIRSDYRTLAPLLGSDIEWLFFEGNPYREGPVRHQAALLALRTQVQADPPSILAAPASRRTWLDEAVASFALEARRLCMGSIEMDPFFGRELRDLFGLGEEPLFEEVHRPDTTIPEWRRGHDFAELIVGRPLPLSHPQLVREALPTEETAATRTLLGLETGTSYIACAPAGTANVSIKVWPAGDFAHCIKALHRSHGLRPLLLGSHSERVQLEELAEAVFETRPALWTGGPEDIPLLAGLLGGASLYLGNDTGAMHLAAALGVPVAAAFGGGTWPRFIPATEKHASLAHPLPCFGCDWDCAFGDAPCLRLIGRDAMLEACTELLAGRPPGIQLFNTLPPSALAIISKAAARHRETVLLLEQRQKSLELTVRLASERETENQHLRELGRTANLEADEMRAEASLLAEQSRAKEEENRMLLREVNIAREALENTSKAARDYRNTIDIQRGLLDERQGLIEALQTELAGTQSALIEKDSALRAQREETRRAREAEAATHSSYAVLSPDASRWALQLSEEQSRAVKAETEAATLRTELERLQTQRTELEQSLNNALGGLGTLEVHRAYQRQLRDKENVLQSLHQACLDRDRVIRELASPGGVRLALRLSALGATTGLPRLASAIKKYSLRLLLGPEQALLGTLRQHEPAPLRWDKATRPRRGARGPSFGIVTPSYNQADFIGSTMESVLSQRYPKVHYTVQDGASRDRSPLLIRARAPELHSWESAPDSGQSDAIRRGFDRLLPLLGPEDLMGWLNSDDLLAPGALERVADHFARNPEVDVVYGHRIIIDGLDREIGRWILPPHCKGDLHWADFIPQETLFWRRRAWDRIGGLDPQFHFALDWDFLLRLEQSGARIERLPYFLGAFRVHDSSKTQAQLSTRGREEMARLRLRIHGGEPAAGQLDRQVTGIRRRSAFNARLLRLGIRY